MMILRERLGQLRAAALQSLFVANDEMNHAGRIGNPKAIEIFPQLFHFVTARRSR